MISLINIVTKKEYFAHVLRRQIFKTYNYIYISWYLIVFGLSLLSYISNDKNVMLLNVFVSGFLLIVASMAICRLTTSFTNGFGQSLVHKWVFDVDGIRILDDRNREDKYHWGNVKSIIVDKVYIRVNWTSGLQSIIKCENHTELGMAARKLFEHNKSV